MYLKNLYRELLIWYKINKISKSNVKILNDKGFRVDWIGRIYTVINLPEEIANHNPEMQQMYILEKLRDFDKTFLDIGISDYVSPEFMPVENSSSYLLILSPDREFARFLPLLKFFIKLIGLYISFRIVWVIIEKNWENIHKLWNHLINLMF